MFFFGKNTKNTHFFYWLRIFSKINLIRGPYRPPPFPTLDSLAAEKLFCGLPNLIGWAGSLLLVDMCCSGFPLFFTISFPFESANQNNKQLYGFFYF